MTASMLEYRLVTPKPTGLFARNYNIPGSGKINPPSITVYRKDASGDVRHCGIIQGPKTLMNWPTSIGGASRSWGTFRCQRYFGHVTVYRADANGDVARFESLKAPEA